MQTIINKFPILLLLMGVLGMFAGIILFGFTFGNFPVECFSNQPNLLELCETSDAAMIYFKAISLISGICASFISLLMFFFAVRRLEKKNSK